MSNYVTNQASCLREIHNGLVLRRIFGFVDQAEPKPCSNIEVPPFNGISYLDPSIGGGKI